MAPRKQKSTVAQRLRSFLSLGPHLLETVGEVEASVNNVLDSAVRVHLAEPPVETSHRVVVLEFETAMVGETSRDWAQMTPFEARRLGELLLKASEVRVARAQE